MIEIIIRDGDGAVLFAQNADSFEKAEESLGFAERYIQRRFPELLEQRLPTF